MAAYTGFKVMEVRELDDREIAEKIKKLDFSLLSPGYKEWLWQSLCGKSCVLLEHELDFAAAGYIGVCAKCGSQNTAVTDGKCGGCGL